MSIAALVRSMAAAGAPPEAIAIAVEAIEIARGRSEKLLTAKQAANRRAYLKRSGNVEAEKGLNSVTESVTENDLKATEIQSKTAALRAPIHAGVLCGAEVVREEERKKEKEVESFALSSTASLKVQNLSERRKARAESDMVLLDRISDVWNRWAGPRGSPLVENLTVQRAVACRRRVDELMQYGHATPDAAFGFLLSKCEESFFIRGSPNKKLNFDQLLKEGFVAKMIEGVYKHQPKTNGTRIWAS